MSETARNAALDELIRRVIVPYSVVGTVLLGWGALVRYSPLPEINTEQESGEVAAANMDKKSIFQFPYLILGAVAIFLHVGTQVIAVDTRSEEHTSELQSLMRNSYAVFCLTKKKKLNK